MRDELINKYRPETFERVLGHEQAIAGLKQALDSDSRAHSYLLYGPSGVGKTTIARIIAKQLKVDVIEFSAAEYSGVDAMRRLCDTGRHRSLRGDGTRMFLMNEVQRLSRGGWDALLTILEEPPPHLYFAMTTTELDKVPEAVLTRCYHVKLGKLGENYIENLLKKVIKTEKWKVKDDVYELILANCDGSPRRALSLLQTVRSVNNSEEAARMVSLLEPSDRLIELCDYLLSDRREWEPVQHILARLTDEDCDITAAGRYIGDTMIKSKDKKEARLAFSLLEALTYPTATYDRRTSFYAAVGRIVWPPDDDK